MTLKPGAVGQLHSILDRFVKDVNYVQTDVVRDILDLITAQADVVTDEQIEAEALSYASKPLAPYLRSEVFADGARWGISKMAQPKTDGWVSVDERLPDDQTVCWGYSDDYDCEDFVKMDDGHFLTRSLDNGDWARSEFGDSVLHWMPRPAPPKTTESD